MKKIRQTLLYILVLTLLVSCSKSGPGLAQYWQSWSDEMLIEWQVRSAVFSSNSVAYCRGNLELLRFQENWKELALHWAALNGFPYQAINDNNLEFDLYFWPDKRNMVEQRLSRQIQSDEPLKTESLQTMVAAEKGLPAMEWLLFNDSLSTEQRCLSLRAISEHYSNQVDSIVRYHEEYPIIQTAWIERSDSKEGASISLNLSFQQAGQMSNRLRNGLDENGKLIPILSEGWRSSLSREIYQASYGSIIQHLDMALERLQISGNSQILLSEQINQMKLLEVQLSESADIDAAPMLKIHQSLIDAERLIEGPLAQDIGVLIGFNNYDGD